MGYNDMQSGYLYWEENEAEKNYNYLVSVGDMASHKYENRIIYFEEWIKTDQADQEFEHWYDSQCDSELDD